MADTVVDSSVALKWVLDEPDSSEAADKFSRLLASGDRAYLLDLARPEAANGIFVQVRRGLITPEVGRTAWHQFQLSPVTIIPSRKLITEAFEIALKYKIAVYDAAFVAAVQYKRCDGVTADVPLQKAIAADFPQIKLLRDW